MELKQVDDMNVKAFFKFYENQYLNNPFKRNSMSGLLKGLLSGKSELCKSAYLEPLMVMDGGRIIMISILAYAYRMPEFLQIGFFEAEKFDMEAFDLIIDRAEALAKEKGADKISGSLNIHVNYGLGFLASHYEERQSFGMPHNPPFYHDFFEKSGFKAIEMISYKKDMHSLERLLNSELQRRIRERYVVRPVDFRDLKAEAYIYTQINNDAFKEHLFYYPRKAEEDLELFKDFRFLLKPENLLFVEKNGTPVGFMLWYPDFHQLMKPSETLGLSTVIKNKFFSDKIDTFKIVEMGVIPNEKGRGAILALFDHCFQCVKGRYANFESGWILENNTLSKSFGIKWADSRHKRYKAYIKDVH